MFSLRSLREKNGMPPLRSLREKNESSPLHSLREKIGKFSFAFFA